MRLPYFLPFIVIIAFASCFAGDTLWFSNGTMKLCDRITTLTDDISPLYIQNDDTVSGKNYCRCGQDRYSLHSVFALQRGNRYLRKYQTGFVTRYVDGRISLFKGINAWTESFKDFGGGTTYSPTVHRDSIKLFSINGRELQQLSFRKNGDLYRTLAENPQAYVYLYKAKKYNLVANSCLAAGTGLVVVDVINLLQGHTAGYCLAIGLSLDALSLPLTITSPRYLLKSIEVYNAGH
jgi:hypothetical protein